MFQGTNTYMYGNSNMNIHKDSRFCVRSVCGCSEYTYSWRWKDFFRWISFQYGNFWKGLEQIKVQTSPWFVLTVGKMCATHCNSDNWIFLCLYDSSRDIKGKVRIFKRLHWNLAFCGGGWPRKRMEILSINCRKNKTNRCVLASCLNIPDFVIPFSISTNWNKRMKKSGVFKAEQCCLQCCGKSLSAFYVWKSFQIWPNL